MKLLKHAMVTAAFTGLMLGMVHPPSGATNIGNEGCTPGYWKNHTSNWQEYKPTRTVGSVFTDYAGTYAGTTLSGALALKGGNTLDGARQILLRAATASVLNAANEGLGYPLRRASATPSGPAIIDTVEAALNSTDRAAILDLARQLDAFNNLGCPLS